MDRCLQVQVVVVGAVDLLLFSGLPEYIVEKWQDFSVTQILREINFGESRSPKTAFFTILKALYFVNLVNFSIQKVQKYIKFKIQSPEMC